MNYCKSINVCIALVVEMLQVHTNRNLLITHHTVIFGSISNAPSTTKVPTLFMATLTSQFANETSLATDVNGSDEFVDKKAANEQH